MKTLQRLAITLGVLAVLGVLLELCLRAILPSLVETGARLALRVPKAETVTVETRGSLLLNALAWRISNVTVTATGVPLTSEVDATVTLTVGRMPLLPTFGKLHDGTAEFAAHADDLDGIVTIVSRGLADHGEMREGQLVTSGVLTDEHFDLPHSPPFEISYEAPVDLEAENGDVLVTPHDVTVQGEGPVASFLQSAMSEQRPVCIADALPAGLTLTGVEVAESGAVTFTGNLAERLISDPDMRRRGSCE
ncbi:LmeA family phospholipid-binding protein [Leucobacter chinensis]|uniref:LmeA family phospholipid-binding protein n=1 Tax=Leucobacter chinensis TaxID=2851010 RepID=UPI001C23284C|nr:LmeA family phospholipid-binding protein [Leucobacter chinensis]